MKPLLIAALLAGGCDRKPLRFEVKPDPLHCRDRCEEETARRNGFGRIPCTWTVTDGGACECECER